MTNHCNQCNQCNAINAHPQVRAAALSHSVPTVGYVVQECSYPGALNPTLIGHRLEDPANVVGNFDMGGGGG